MSGEVLSHLTPFTIFIIVARLRKWRPIKRSGNFTDSANSDILKDEVLEQNITLLEKISEISLRTAFF
jgi:hypothetical protein